MARKTQTKPKSKTKRKSTKKESSVYTKYADDVLSGKIVAGTLIKLACKRYLSWFKRKDFEFVPEKAERVINFCQHLKSSTGKFAGKPFLLTDWQKFLIYNIYGFVHKDTGHRVIRQVYCQLARKSGKSSLVSALSLYHLIADNEMDGQIIFSANSAPQAKLCFDITNNFVKSIEPNGKLFKRYRDSIRFDKMKSVIKVVSADSTKLDGLNISMAVIDEYHEARNNSILNVLQSATGMRTQPLIFIITTAGFHLESPCYEMRQVAENILRNKLTDDSFGIFIYEMDQKDSFEDEKNWIKAQPNLDYTVTTDYIKAELLKAKNTPSLLVNFKTKILNEWCSSERGEWIPHEYIVKNSFNFELTDERFQGCYCYVGLDLSSVSDITAISVMIPDLDGKHYFKNYYFLPSRALEESSNRDFYRKMARDNKLLITPNNAIDYDYIFDKINEINSCIPINTIAYDPWKSAQLIIKLNEIGYNTSSYSQTIGNMSIPSMELETLLLTDNSIVIDNNIITQWMFSNVVMKCDTNGNMKPMKPDNAQSQKKIDGIVAMLNALGYHLSQTTYNNEIFGFTVE